MKPGGFDFVRPETLAGALAALGSAGATPLAGGQSLLVLLRLRLTAPETLVDVARLPELSGCTAAGGLVRIGAATTHAALEDGAVACPALMRRVAAGIAYRAIRTLGTIGGSLALADPAADWPACLLALDAAVLLHGPAGERRVPVDAFLAGAFTTTLAPGEVIAAVEVPDAPARIGWAKLARKAGAFADSLAAVVWPGAGGPRVVLGATATRPRLLPRTALALAAGADAGEAIRADVAEADPDADAFRRRCHAATIRRALQDLGAA